METPLRRPAHCQGITGVGAVPGVDEDQLPEVGGDDVHQPPSSRLLVRRQSHHPNGVDYSEDRLALAVIAQSVPHRDGEHDRMQGNCGGGDQDYADGGGARVYACRTRRSFTATSTT